MSVVRNFYGEIIPDFEMEPELLEEMLNLALADKWDEANEFFDKHYQYVLSPMEQMELNRFNMELEKPIDFDRPYGFIRIS